MTVGQLLLVGWDIAGNTKATGKCLCYKTRSVDHTQQECRLPAFKFSEAAEIRGGDVVIDLAEISVIGEVDYIEAETDLARPEVKPGRNAEVPVELGIDGKKHRKSLGVGQPNVILTLIYFGI